MIIIIYLFQRITNQYAQYALQCKKFSVANIAVQEVKEKTSITTIHCSRVTVKLLDRALCIHVRANLCHSCSNTVFFLSITNNSNNNNNKKNTNLILMWHANIYLCSTYLLLEKNKLRYKMYVRCRNKE